MKQFLLLFSLFFLFATSSGQRHKYYFVNKVLPEFRNAPKQQFSSLQTLSQIALKPGDTIFFYAGDTLTGNISLSNIHGTKEQNIVLTSFGGGNAIISGNNKEALVIAKSSHFQLLNLQFIGAGRKEGNTTDGVKVNGCEDFSITNVEISGFQKSGLILYNSQHAEVNKVFAHENGFAGILVEGDYQKRNSNAIHLINCRAVNNPGDPTNLNNHSGNGILVGNCKNVLVEYCTATNNGWDMPRIGNGPVGIWAYEADSVTIQHCISYRNKTAKGAADGGGFDLDGGVTNSVIQYCLSYENWGSGYGIFEYPDAGRWDNNTLRYCISINDGFITDYASGMLIWNGWGVDSLVTRFYAYNNLFYNDRKYAFAFIYPSNHRQFAFLNNIFIASDTSDIFYGVDSSRSDFFLGNVWMRKSGGFAQSGFTDLEKWAQATGYEVQQNRLVGASSHRRLFFAAPHINVEDPYLLKTDPVLKSFCIAAFNHKGVDPRKLFSIDVGRTDFFGAVIPLHGRMSAGICERR